MLSTRSGGLPAANRGSNWADSCVVTFGVTTAAAYFFRYAAAANPPYSSLMTTSTGAFPSTVNGFSFDTGGATVWLVQPLTTAPANAPCNKVRRLSITAGYYFTPPAVTETCS